MFRYIKSTSKKNIYIISAFASEIGIKTLAYNSEKPLRLELYSVVTGRIFLDTIKMQIVEHLSSEKRWSLYHI